MADVRTETMTVNMGPQHPSTHGVLRLVLELDGETVVSVSPTDRLPAHRHREDRRAEEVAAGDPARRAHGLPRRAVQQPRVLPRRSRSCSASTSRCRSASATIRVLIAELQRISSHLVWFGTHAMEIGAITGLLYAFREREQLDEPQRAARRLPLLPELHPRRRPARGHPARLQGSGQARSSIGSPASSTNTKTLITKNPIWLDRTRGVGVISLRGLLQVGPVRPDRARRRRRLRRAPRLPVSSATTPTSSTSSAPSNGDVYDRYLTRVAEMRESVKICNQALERIDPVGAWARQRQAHRAAAEGSGLHGDGSADSALPDLFAGLHGAGRRGLRAGRRAARRARLLRRVGRHQPAVARRTCARRDCSPARRCTSSSSAA